MQQSKLVHFIEDLFSVSLAAAFFFINWSRLSALTTALCPPWLDDLDDSKEEDDEDFVIFPDSADFTLKSLVASALESTDDLWKGFVSDLTLSFSFSFDKFAFSGVSDTDDVLVFDWSLLLELDFDWSDVFEEDDELDRDWSVLEEVDLDCSDLGLLDFDWSDFVLLDFDWSVFVELDFDPDRFAAKLASPLNGFAAPVPGMSLLDDELWNGTNVTIFILQRLKYSWSEYMS